MTHGLDQLEFAYGDINSVSKTRDIMMAWKKPNSSDLGVYSDTITPKYQVWRVERINNVVLPNQEWTEEPQSIPTGPSKPSEVEIMERRFQVEEKRWKVENQELKTRVEDLQFGVERQESEMRKITMEQAESSKELRSLGQENIRLRAKRMLPDYAEEFEKARREIEFWKGKAFESGRSFERYSQEKQKWDDQRTYIHTRLKRCLQENEQLKATVSTERTRVVHMRTERDSLCELMGAYDQELRGQARYIGQLKEDFEARENNLIKSIHEAQNMNRTSTIESLGRCLYIDHLTEHIMRAEEKAKEMLRRVKELRRVRFPTREYEHQLQCFLIEAQDQYKQIVNFYGSSPKKSKDVTI